MDLEEVVPARSASQLGQCLHKGHAFDIANRASELDDADVRLLVRVVNRYPCDTYDPVLDRICDVGNDLHGTAQVVAPSFPLDHMLVDLACRYVVFSRQCYVEVSLIVAQVQVNFAAIVQNKDLAMPVSSLSQLHGRGNVTASGTYALSRIHRAGIDVQVRVDLDGGDVQSKVSIS